ncbi:unnamed protein product [Rotaria sp. Silwood1]|nr:unnamed protein product [Rotaria sp. Silwood1]CAF1228697.1 unnamed protein product [Rotaria sp. Silwood1]
MMIKLLLIILTIAQINGYKKHKDPTTENTRPIIGILTQPTPTLWMKPNRTTYIAASYVKYIEATGAQVVPIRMYQSIDYYFHLFNSLNGVLFPGGDLTDEYYSVAKLFYMWSLKDFDEIQKSFPLWGTCLGFEVLLMLTGSPTVSHGNDHFVAGALHGFGEYARLAGQQASDGITELDYAIECGQKATTESTAFQIVPFIHLDKPGV